MNILFFVEPHPIRNEMFHHNNILLSKWGKAILNWEKNGQLNEHQVKIYCHQMYYQMVQTKLPELLPYIITSNSDEEYEIHKNLKIWNSISVKKWSNLMVGKSDKDFVIYKKIIDRIKVEFDFDAVFFWGMNRYVSNYCEKLGAKPFFMELASIRSPLPKSIYIDNKGVNGHSCITELYSSEMYTLLENAYSPQELIYKNKDSLNQPCVFDSKFDFNNHITSIRMEYGDNLVLVPLQICDDSNILIGSEYENAFEFARDVVNIFKNSKYTLVFKPHPGAKHRGGIVYNDHYKTMEYVNKSANCIWYDKPVLDHEYISFINGFKSVITINSSVGFEAMLLGVPVFPLGKAIYKSKDYQFDKKHIPHLISNEKYKYIELGKIISNFIMNYSFISEEIYIDTIDTIINRVNAFDNKDSYKTFEKISAMNIRGW